MTDGDAVPEDRGGDELIDMPDGAIRVPRNERAAGLGHVRRGIRRRASLAPLLFLVGAAVVIGAIALLRGQDPFESGLEVGEVVAGGEGVSAVDVTVTVTNTDGADAVVLSHGVNASGPVRTGPAVMTGATDTAVELSSQPTLPAGTSVEITFSVEFECVDGEVFDLMPVVDIQIRQRLLQRVFTVPGEPFPRYECVDGLAVLSAG